MIITWKKSNQHLLSVWKLLRVDDHIDTTEFNIPEEVVEAWIVQGFACVEDPPLSRYRIIAETCVECGACIEACPLAAITSDPYAIDPALCNGCGACAEVCPVEAIERYNWIPPEPEEAKIAVPVKAKKTAKKATKEA